MKLRIKLSTIERRIINFSKENKFLVVDHEQQKSEDERNFASSFLSSTYFNENILKMLEIYFFDHHVFTLINYQQCHSNTSN
jgi:hypothetical protein